MELADVKIGETYLFTSETDPDSGRNVKVIEIDPPERGLPWPVTATILGGENDGDDGAFWASELSPVV